MRLIIEGLSPDMAEKGCIKEVLLKAEKEIEGMVEMYKMLEEGL